MIGLLKTIIWGQMGAAIDTLHDMVAACPDDMWRARLYDTGARRPEFSEVWYLVYHALFWLDLYLTGTEDGYLPPAPFTLIEQDDFGPLPDRAYTKAELLDYLAECRGRCKATIAAMTEESAQERCWFGWGEVTFAELMIYNMRHVQEHASQLSLALGQNGVAVPDYVTTINDTAV